MSTNTLPVDPRTRQPRQRQARPSLYTPTSVRFALLATAAYLGLSALLIGFRTDQLVLVVLFNALYFISHGTRRFILCFSVFAIYWIIFDYQKAFPNYRYNTVHIQDLYLAEKQLFGLQTAEGVLTPNEYFASRNWPAVDFVGGLFYLCWIPVPLAFAAVLFFRDRRRYFQFALSFVAVNLIGWAGYYLYPAAPPWYVAQYGFDFLPQTPGNTAGLARFDTLTGIRVFDSIYAKSSNVFAAMPSLHAAYIMIVVYFAARARMRWWLVASATVTLGIWFGAVYTSHHYVLDVLAGITAGISGIALFELWSRTKLGGRTLQRMVQATT